MKTQKYMKRFFLLTCLILLCVALVTGCGNKKNKNGSMISDDGRSYGGVIKAEMKEKVSTAFFDVTVDEVEKCYNFQFSDGLYQAEKGMAYLLVKLTIQNTYPEKLSMSITDFTLDYDGNKSKKVITGYGKSELNQDEYMDNLFTLKKGESVTKTILYTVEDKEEYKLNYTEYYEDKFEGDSYQINVKAKEKDASAK